MTGRYRLVESIGQGGMGRVWRATDEVLDRPVAVKEMRIDGLGSEDTRTRRERTLREARATARIDHPNVVRVYDVVDEGERLWIVMELVAGRSLEQIMAEDGPLGPRETARIGLGLVTALRQVHARGVLHRDIKPGNVLVERGGRRTDGARGGSGDQDAGGGHGEGREGGDRRVVLTDFGIAAIQDAKALTMVGMLVGSPDYMAPERISGRPQGPPSDVWSLGATLCAALAGHSPFSRDTTLATLHAVLYEEPRLPPDAGPLHTVLAALLLKDPAARPTLTALESVLAPIAFPASRDRGPAAEGPPRAGRPPLGEPPARTLLDARRGPPAQDPRRPAPPRPDPEPRDSVSGSPRPPDRSDRSERCALPAVPEAPGVSLTRSRAVTERRPAPSGPTPGAEGPPPGGELPGGAVPDRELPRGELPGPAVPAASADGGRGPRTRPGRAGPRPGRRAGALAAVVAVVVVLVVAVGTVVAIMLAKAPGTHDRDGRAAASSPRESEASGPAATGSGPSASPTVEGTFRPPSLPPGAHQEAGGFAWATPRGWRRDVKTGAEVHYTSPDGVQELVAKSSLARGDLMDAWQTSEQNARQGRDYRKIRLEETTFRGLRAVVWEYTFTLKGTPWHARLLGFDENGKSYQVNTWYQPGTEATALRTYEKVKDSFTVT
ncbi:protein kinase [Streptomyces sp. B21-097]